MLTLSNFIGLFLAATFAMSTIGAPVQAQSVNTGANQGAVAALSDKQRRRMDYYAAQSHMALQAFNLNSQSESELTDLRKKVQRLSDAGQRSGLDIAATALYFEAYVAENASAPLPVAFLDAAGRFDSVSLFTSVHAYFDNLTPVEMDFAAADEADMAAISSIAQNSPAQDLVIADTPPVQPVVVVALPEIAPDAPASVRAILERVRLVGEDWVITVEQGDSLAQYANAIYGDRNLFQQIFEANISQLITPSSILIGQNIILPKP